MKICILLTLCLALLANQSLAQNNPNESIDKQLRKYQNMKKAGTALIIVGGALALTGIIIEGSYYIKSINDYEIPNESEEYSHTGAVLFGTGAVILGGGIPLRIIGARKYEKLYRSTPDVVSLKINSTPSSTGLSLTYRF